MAGEAIPVNGVRSRAGVLSILAFVVALLVAGCGSSGSGGFRGLGFDGVRGAFAGGGCATYDGPNPSAAEFTATRVEFANKQFDLTEKYESDPTGTSREEFVDLMVAEDYADVIARVPSGGFAEYTELLCDMAKSQDGLTADVQAAALENLEALKSNPAYADVDFVALGKDVGALFNRYPIVSVVNPLMLCDLTEQSGSTMTEVLEDMAVSQPEMAELNAKSLQIICPDLVGDIDTDYSSESGACVAEVDGVTGRVTITGGAIDCTFAKAMIAERDGDIGYFNGPSGQSWACGSGDILADYECYSTAGPERFKWEAN
ncbi:hypothetical protein BFL43_05125 [Williamsia sp. 1135]|nr:hypothetical protein BFL43_05125 [Williamsia sp. 1135]